LAGLAIMLCGCGEHPQATVEFSDAWTRETTAGVPVGAGYGVVRNNTARPIRLVSATSPAANRIEIHTVVTDKGVMRMRPLADGLEIPSGREIALKPGGHHLMLIGLHRALRSGEVIPVAFEFEGAAAQTVGFHVRSVSAPQGADHE